MHRKPKPNSASPANIQNVVPQNSSFTAKALKIKVDSDRTNPAQSMSAASAAHVIAGLLDLARERR